MQLAQTTFLPIRQTVLTSLPRSISSSASRCVLESHVLPRKRPEAQLTFAQAYASMPCIRNAMSTLKHSRRAWLELIVIHAGQEGPS